MCVEILLVMTKDEGKRGGREHRRSSFVAECQQPRTRSRTPCLRGARRLLVSCADSQHAAISKHSSVHAPEKSTDVESIAIRTPSPFAMVDTYGHGSGSLSSMDNKRASRSYGSGYTDVFENTQSRTFLKW